MTTRTEATHIKGDSLEPEVIQDALDRIRTVLWDCEEGMTLKELAWATKLPTARITTVRARLPTHLVCDERPARCPGKFVLEFHLNPKWYGLPHQRKGTRAP